MFNSIFNWFSGTDTQPTLPDVNINGLPMVGCLDVHGNVYGSTANDFQVVTDYFGTDHFGGGSGCCDSYNSFNDSFASSCDDSFSSYSDPFA